MVRTFVTLILGLWACQPAKYAVSDEPPGGHEPRDSGATHTDEPADPPIDNGLVLRSRWDGEDGLIFDWTEIPLAVYELTIIGPADYSYKQTDLSVTELKVDDLFVGEYAAEVTAKANTTAIIDTANLVQYVGPNRLLYRSEIPLSGAMDVWGSGDVAVIAGGKNTQTGVLVVDVSNPENPILLGEIKDIGFVRDIKIFDDLLFTAVDPDADGCTLCDGIGVRIFDFSDPENPTLLSTIDSPASWVHNMTYSDGYLYLASMMEEVVAIVDISDPKNPTRVATWYADLPPFSQPLPGPGGGPHDMMAQGERLYVAHFTGFSIVDISDPTHPSTLASVRVDMGMHNVWPNHDGSLMVGTQEIFNGPLTLWDIRDLTDIQLLDSISTGSDRTVHNGYFDGASVLAAWYIDGIFSFDVSGNRLVETGHYDTFPGEIEPPADGREPSGPPISGAWGIWSFGEHVILGDTERGMMIFDHYPTVVTSH